MSRDFAPDERARMAGVSPRVPKSIRPLMSDSLWSGPFGKPTSFAVFLQFFLDDARMEAPAFGAGRQIQVVQADVAVGDDGRHAAARTGITVVRTAASRAACRKQQHACGQEDRRRRAEPKGFSSVSSSGRVHLDKILLFVSRCRS